MSNMDLNANMEEELLISRVVDGAASSEDWEALATAAAADPELWRRLAATLEAQAVLRAELNRALAVADRVEIPSAPVRRGAPRWTFWTGWAAAAAVALAWLGLGWGPGSAGGRPAAQPSLTNSDLTVAGGSDAVSAEPASYLQSGAPPGHVLGELPAVMLETRPAADGDGQDVFYVRRLLERARVNRMYQVNRNELGQPVAVPVSSGPAAPRPPL